jgi:hypothetical protein
MHHAFHSRFLVSFGVRSDEVGAPPAPGPPAAGRAAADSRAGAGGPLPAECDYGPDGAAGGAGVDGGDGGQSEGGAIALFGSGNVNSIRDSVFANNQSLGGDGGNGGDGGAGQGGAIRALLGTINIDHALLGGNEAIGGAGGAAGDGGVGGNGGNGQGGALLTTFGVEASLSNSLLIGNLAEGGAGAAGGNGLGGAIYNGGPFGPFSASHVTLDHCLVTLNDAEGGAGGEGGSDGEGVGGVYNLETLVLLMTLISRNDASTSNDNVFP